MVLPNGKSDELRRGKGFRNAGGKFERLGGDGIGGGGGFR